MKYFIICNRDYVKSETSSFVCCQCMEESIIRWQSWSFTS